MNMTIKIKGNIDRKDLDKLFRGLTLGIYNDVILGTPVDTGRARGNWQLAIGSAPTGEVSRLEKGIGSNQLRQAESKTKRPLAGKSVFIANNLAYIGLLEEGSSTQGSGFVENALNRAKARIIPLE